MRQSVLARSALVALAVAVTVVAQREQLRQHATTSFVVVDAAVAVAFVIAGLGAWRLGSRPMLGTVAVLGAVAWQVGTLAMAFQESPVTFPLFALSGYHDVVLAFLMLSYPAGLLVTRARRTAFGLLVLGCVAGSVNRLVSFDPRAWGCDECPSNPFAVSADEGRFVWLQEWTGRFLGAVVAMIAVITVVRWATGSVVARRAAGAVPIAGTVWAVLFLQDTFLRPAEELVIADPAAFYVMAAARGAIPLGVVAGLIWIVVGQSRISDLFASLDESAGRDRIEPVLQAVVGDPRLEMWWRSDEGTYARSDAPERQLSAVDADRHQVVTTIAADDGAVLGLLKHDVALLDDQRFSTAIHASVRLIADHERLSRQVISQLDEVRASRIRILAAAGAERARLERDLHDGSQQRLVSLALQLRSARDALGGEDPGGFGDTLDRAMKELGEAVADLRELARGIHPTALSDGGLAAALPLLADRIPLPTAIHVTLPGRLPVETEAALYFVAAEALTNAVKHASADTCSVDVRIDAGRLVLTVDDDGIGGAVVAHQGGLRGLCDRIEAFGGNLSVTSDNRSGTRVVATVPLDPAVSR